MSAHLHTTVLSKLSHPYGRLSLVNHTKSLKAATVFANIPILPPLHTHTHNFFGLFFLLLQAAGTVQRINIPCFVSGIQLASQLKPGLRKVLRQYLSMCYQSNLLPPKDLSKQSHVFEHWPLRVNLEVHMLLDYSSSPLSVFCRCYLFY